MTVLLICLIVLAAAIQVLTLDHGLDNVTYDLHLSDRIVECDQVFTVTTVVENRKILPLLFLRLSESYPQAINLYTDRTSVTSHQFIGLNLNYTEVTQVMYLMSNQRLTRTLEASIPIRGIHKFKKALFTGGDLLGIKDRTVSVNFYDYIVVLPKRINAPQLQKTFGNFLGDMSVRRFILEDPVLTLSFREYTGREPMKDISWPRSMRDGKLMVKQYDYTMELSATVILNTEFSGKFDSEAFERALSVTRGVCEQLEEKKIPYNFCTNTVFSGIMLSRSSIGDGLGNFHLMSILENLGCASEFTSKSFPELMDSVVTRAESARAHILVTVDIDNDKNSIIKQAEKFIGSEIFVIDASKEVF